MFSPARSLLRFRTLGLLAIACVVLAFAEGRLRADRPARVQTSETSSPIIFDGWRRTASGWERFPFKDARPSINDWIAHQKEEEANNPLSQPLQRLGQVHPIRIACAEVAFACLIAFVASGRQSWTAQ